MSSEIKRSSRRTNSLTLSVQTSSKTSLKDEVLSPKSPKKIDIVDKSDIGDLNPNTPRLSTFAPNSTNSPKHLLNSQTPDYIFLNRKKVMDILITENVVRESQAFQTPSLPSTPKSSTIDSGFSASRISMRGDQFNNLPGRSTHRVSIFSPAEETTNAIKTRSSIRMSIFSPSVENSPISPLNSLKTKFEEIREDLNKAQKFQENVLKFNPMSPQSLIHHEGYAKNKMIKIVKKHHHRLFGMDHLNLKKVNQVLTSKAMTPKGHLLPHIQDPITPNMMNKRNSQPDFSSAFFMASEEESTPKINDFKIYEYNPVNDDFEIANQDLQGLDINLESFTNQRNDRKYAYTPRHYLEGTDWEMKETLPDYLEDGINENYKPKRGKSLKLPKIKSNKFDTFKHDKEESSRIYKVEKEKEKLYTFNQEKPVKEEIKQIIGERYDFLKREQDLKKLSQIDPKSLGVKELDDLCYLIEMKNKKMAKGFRMKASIRNSVA